MASTSPPLVGNEHIRFGPDFCSHSQESWDSGRFSLAAYPSSPRVSQTA